MTQLRSLFLLLAVVALALGCEGLVAGLGSSAPPEGSESARRLEPGPFAVGSADFELVDESRPTMENGEVPGVDSRTLAVTVWSPADAEGLVPLVVYSHAKVLALPGERIGYIAVNPAYPDRNELVDGLTFCNRSLGFVNAPALMQHVVRGLQGVSVDVADYQRKRDRLYAQLCELGYSVVKPQGAFYFFPKCPIEDDVAFVEALQEWNVLVVPGRGFGLPGYFRISYCLEDQVLAGGMEGLAQAARRFGLSGGG